MTDDARMRFRKILTWGQFIKPTPPMQGYRDGAEYVVESFVECWSYEVQDFATNATSEDGWLLQFNYPQFVSGKYIWKLIKATIKKG